MGPLINRVARLVAPRTFEIFSEEMRPPDFGHVVVRVISNGVCASESHAWEDQLPDYPVDMGHEPVGRIEILGPGVGGLEIGDRVTGRFGPSFARFALVDAEDIVAVPTDVSTDNGMAEPLGCVVEALRRTPAGLGDRVAVVGAGYMGLILIELLTTTGYGEVVALDTRGEALSFALEMGASAAESPTEPERAEADAFDVVFEASGTQAGLDTASSLVREHGVLSILGFHQGGRRTVDMELWNWKSIDVVNAHVRSGRSSMTPLRGDSS